MNLIWKLVYSITDEELIDNIDRLEKRYEIVLPVLYKDILKKKREKTLSSQAMEKNYKGKEDWITIYFTSFDEGAINLFNVNKRNSDVRPKEIIFFAYDSGGNYYGFDFKDNPNDPKIVYYDHSEVPPIEDLIADGFEGDEIEEEQRSCYKTVYDNFEDLYKHLEIGQEYWIEEEFGGEETEAFKNYLNKFNWTY
ncbi:MAG: SMI1/KNR4 family protein [Clostridium sp.]